MKYFILLLLSSLILSCSNETKETTPKKENKNPSSKTLYYENGNIKAIISLKDSKKDGLSTDYYENGNIHLKVMYKNNLKHGENIWFFENGGIYRKSEYKEDVKDGLEVYYYENGIKQSEQTFKKGQPTPDLKEYTKKGKLKKKYPKLILNQKTDYNTNTIIINAKLSNNKSAIFNILDKESPYAILNNKSDETIFIPPEFLNKNKEKKAIFSVFFSPDEVVFRTVTIAAAYKTYNRRVKILTKNINIAAN